MANVNIGAADIAKIRLSEQGSDPSTPASTYGFLYIKTDGLYLKDDGGTATGPFIDASTLATSNVGAAWNGSFVESFDALVTSDGVTVTMSLEQSGTGDLTMRFSDGETTLDCTPAQTLSLTAGSDASPTENYVYIPQSTKVLTLSTSDWPAAEHIKVGYFLVPSATFVQSTGCYINQNWNDHATGTDNQGHLMHAFERIRRSGAQYHSGLALTVTITTNGGSPDNVDVAFASGEIYQMHKQSVAALDTGAGDTVLVVNDSVTAYDDVTDLNGLLTDADGDSMSGNYFNLVLWTAANKAGEFSPIMVNLPTGSYNTQSDAINDVDGEDVYSMPDPFLRESSTGALLYRITLKHSAASGGTWTLEDTKDLRGFTPTTAGGGGAGGGNTFADNAFQIYDEGDNTKIVAFSVGGLTTATTRTITVPDNDLELIGIVGGALDVSLTAGTIKLDTNGARVDILSGGAVIDIDTEGGNLTIDSGGGNFNLASAGASVIANVQDGKFRVDYNGSNANAVRDVFQFNRETSGTPANGIGAREEWRIEGGSGITAAVEKEVRFDDVTGGAEYTRMNFDLKINGSMTEILDIRDGYVQTARALWLPELSGSPSTPDSGNGAIYFKTDGKLYAMNDAGTETALT